MEIGGCTYCFRVRDSSYGNAYRVLLTRARQGIIICIPKGNSRLTQEGFPEDPTRLPEFYDGTYEYLKSIGIEEV